ncbi:MAG: TPM domain-containing protein [Ruminococcus sp.]|nr:TPM domain-containing protein [Ruminococcus sp.]
MRKFSFLIALSLAAGLFLAGCGEKPAESFVSSESSPESSEDGGGQGSSDMSLSDEESSEEIPPVTESLPQVDDLEPAEGTYVYDNADVLSSEDFSACNDYASHLYKNYLINAAVLTAKSLGGKSVYDYAADAYDTLYEGRGSGLLLVINEDSGSDYLFRSGSCAVFVDDDTVNSAFFWATKDIVSGDYRSAVLRLMQLGELCPELVFDNGGLLTAEEVAELESELESCGGDVAVLATSNGTGTPNEDIARSYLERRFGEGNGTMIMLDAQSKSTAVVSGGELPSELDKAKTEADKSASAGKYAEAAKKLIEALK